MSYAAPASIGITASAGDVDGAVAQVDFYAGSDLVRSDTTSPYTVTWTSVPPGTYSLSARAIDDSGATSTSQPITVSVATNAPPTVAISAPAGGTSYTAPASIAITTVANDSDGMVARVDFYAGALLVGSDVTAPFALTWSSVAVGAYTITAVAIDNAGATTRSPGVSVTVVAAPVSPVMTKVLFVPPTDYATNVTFCTVELRRSVDAVIAVPIATRNLGKPVAVGGDVTVDISTLVDPLAAGSYYAIVVSTGPGGSTSSAKSALFTR
jgi:hypothetical protein